MFEKEAEKWTIDYVLSWSKRENVSHIEKYHSFFKWLKRIIQLLYKENTSVLIYKPYKE